MIHSPNAHKKVEPGTRSCIRVSHMGWQEPDYIGYELVLLRSIGRNLDSVPQALSHDAGIPGSGLTHWATMPMIRILFQQVLIPRTFGYFLVLFKN